MKKFLFFFLFSLICFNLFAQKQHRKHRKHVKRQHTTALNTSSDKVVWNKAASFSFLAGQTGSKNWASGSDLFSLSANAFFDAHANRTHKNCFWNNELALSYGLINTDEYATIKNDDKIDYLTTLGFKTKKLRNIGFGSAFAFRSQFASGYDRNYLNQGIKRRTSGLFAPAYLTFAPFGVAWQTKHISFYAAPAFRAVIVSNSPYSYMWQGGTIPGTLVNDKNTATQERSLAEMYGVDPSKEVNWQYGLYASLGFHLELCKNVNWAGRIDAFSDIHHQAPQNVKVFWTNMFTLKVNNWLRAIYSLDIAYDDDIKKFGFFHDHADLQVKSILGVGVSLNTGWGMHGHMHDRMSK